MIISNQIIIGNSNVGFNPLSFNPHNYWDGDNLTIVTTTTTANDLASVHDVANPAAGNQPTFDASDADFNNLGSLAFDGSTDYLYKSFANYGSTFNDGCIYIVFRTGADFAANYPIISFSAEASNIEKVQLYTFTNSKLRFLINYGGTNNIIENDLVLTINTTYVARFCATGTLYTTSINNANTAQTTISGANDGKYFNDLTTLTNIVLGARINTSSLFSNQKIAAWGSFPSLTVPEDASLMSGLMTKYGV